MTSYAKVHRYEYAPGNCLHCAEPEDDHPVPYRPRDRDPNGRLERLGCESYTATGLMREVKP